MISLFIAIRSPILTIPLSTNRLLKTALPPIKIKQLFQRMIFEISTALILPRLTLFAAEHREKSFKHSS